jgi:hypothetical protein
MVEREFISAGVAASEAAGAMTLIVALRYLVVSGLFSAWGRKLRPA